MVIIDLPERRPRDIRKRNARKWVPALRRQHRQATKWEPAATQASVPYSNARVGARLDASIGTRRRTMTLRKGPYCERRGRAGNCVAPGAADD